jgi:outer membrane protein assembly factor BamD
MKRTCFSSVLAMACVLAVPAFAQNQNPTVPNPAPVTTTNADGSIQTTTSTTTDSTGKPVQSVGTSITFNRGKKKKVSKDDKIQQTKDTRKAEAKARSAEALVGVDSRLPDKQLYDKAVVAMNKGHFDVARLDLQTMLNTYPNSEYQMRAKLAIADSWYKEGGTAALTQAESEYADFRVFFPNAPEAAEAQMRIGDIYFRQMDRPDRDYGKAIHAEEEYRRMLTDYPDSVLIPAAKQRLREVQEVLASREADIASFYGTRGNMAAEIARFDTVVDTYPLYSHMDDVLIALGDAYEQEARFYRARTELPEAGRARLEKEYDERAAQMYRKVVLEHSAAPHVDDARERLEAMNLPVPVPSAEQVASSQALENSRATYRLSDRVQLLFLHKPDTVLTAGAGEPSLTDPKPVGAPTIVNTFTADFRNSFTPPGAAETPAPAATAAATDAPAPAASTPAPPAAPLSLSDIPAAEGAPTGAPAVNMAAPAGSGAPSSNGVGIEVLPSDKPAPAVPTGLETVKPAGTAVMAPVEAAAPAPDQVNDAAGKPTPAGQVVAPGTKAPKPEFDKADESSSKHKPKKGIKKVIPPNPF